jgi:excisionase family DNA binding protein
MAERLLTVKEVAERLQLSTSAVYELTDAGLLRSLRLGVGRGAVRIRPADLEAYLGEAESR